MSAKRVRVSEEAYIVVSNLQRLRIVIEILRDVFPSEPELMPAYSALYDKMLELERCIEGNRP